MRHRIRRIVAPSIVSAVIIAAVGAALDTTHAATQTPSPIATAAPRVPSAPTGAALLGGAEVFWTDNSHDEIGFRITIRVDGNPNRTATYDAAANATSFLLPPGAPHVCETNGGPALFGSVVAVGTGGDSEPAHFGLFAICGNAPSPAPTARATGTATPHQSGTPVAAPAAPSDLLLLGGAQVLWHDNSDNETGFRITIRLMGDNPGRQATYTTPADITSFLVPPDAPHVCERPGDSGITFSVVAFNAAGSAEARSGIISECGDVPAPTATAAPSVRLPNTGSGGAHDDRGGHTAWLIVAIAATVALQCALRAAGALLPAE